MNIVNVDTNTNQLSTADAVFSLFTTDDLARIAVASASKNNRDIQCDDGCQICGLKHNQTYDPSALAHAGNKFNPMCVVHQLRIDLKCLDVE